MLYTSFYDSEKLDKKIDEGKFIVSISRSEPKWLEVDYKSWLLAPTKEVFEKSKYVSDSEFQDLYFQQLDLNKDKVIRELKWLSSKNAILCCWCKEFKECHRYTLAIWAGKCCNILIKEL